MVGHERIGYTFDGRRHYDDVVHRRIPGEVSSRCVSAVWHEGYQWPDSIRWPILLGRFGSIVRKYGAVHIHGKEVYVDIFSCKSFEINPALELIKQRLKLRNMRVEEISRPILG